MDRHSTRLRPRLWLTIGIGLIALGVTLAAVAERAGGVSIRDVRFVGPDGTVFSALVYRPAGAAPGAPAPGILAVHGYLNSRETQSPFAIELARRGYVVVALDQRGHGYSGGAAATRGFGGPEGLAYLRSLPFVDPGQIGMEGHSMGGWAILAAAAAMPHAYRSMVLEGSSTGAPFAAPGTPAWPRNVEVVESRLDEFAPLMWGVARAADVGAAPKLEALFGTAAPVQPGRIYGDIASGTARRLTQPFATHPGDHLSMEAVADAADWFALTLEGGRPLPRADQIWWVKEIGTGLALLGVGALMLGLVDLLLGIAPFSALRALPAPLATLRGWRWPTLLGLTALTPALTYYALPLTLPLIRPSALFPQGITNVLSIWALANAGLAVLFGWALGVRPGWAKPRWGLSAALAVVVVGALYAVAVLASLVQVDFRFWVVALKPFSGRQAIASLSYVVPFTVFLILAFRSLAALAGRSSRAHYLLAASALAGGFLLLTGVQYVYLFATGALPLPFEALNAIVAIQFVPLFAGLGILAAHTWRRTGDPLPGALIGGLFITWYVVAGTATHVA